MSTLTNDTTAPATLDLSSRWAVEILTRSLTPGDLLPPEFDAELRAALPTRTASRDRLAAIGATAATVTLTKDSEPARVRMTGPGGSSYCVPHTTMYPATSAEKVTSACREAVKPEREAWTKHHPRPSGMERPEVDHTGPFEFADVAAVFRALRPSVTSTTRGTGRSQRHALAESDRALFVELHRALVGHPDDPDARLAWAPSAENRARSKARREAAKSGRSRYWMAGEEFEDLHALGVAVALDAMTGDRDLARHVVELATGARVASWTTGLVPAPVLDDGRTLTLPVVMERLRELEDFTAHDLMAAA